MMLRTLLLIALSLNAALVGIGQNSGGLDRFSGEQINRDLDSLYQWILDIHPSPYVHCSSLELEASLQQAKLTFSGGGTLFAAAQMVAKTSNTLKDSHTGIALQSFSTQLGEQYGHLPLEIKTVQNRLIVTAIADHPAAIGQEVLRVNNTPARSILGSALALVSQEGDAGLARLRMAEKLWNDIAPFAVGASIADTLAIELSTGEFVRLPVFDNAAIRNWHMGRNQGESIEWKEILHADSLISLNLSIGHFHPDNVRFFRQSLKSAFKHAKELESREGDRFRGVIIDLRGNSGGNIAMMAELLPYLIQKPTALPAGVQIKGSIQARERWGTNRLGLVPPKSYLKNLRALNASLASTAVDSIAYVPFDRSIRPSKRLNYQGPASLLLDGLSASATVSIASWFIRSGRGKTFGEPPMGSVSGTFGNPVRVILPETGLAVNVASARYFTQQPIRWESSPILVDFPISKTATDFQSGTDPVLEAALNWQAAHSEKRP